MTATQELPVLPPRQPTAAGPQAPYRVVHRLPGRLRLRWPSLAQDPALAGALQQSLTQQAGICQVRLNRAAQSVVIGYRVELTNEAGILDQLAALLPLVVEAADRPAATGPLTAATVGWRPLTLPSLAAGLGLLSHAPRLAGLRPLAGLALLGAVLPIAQRAWGSLVRERRLNIDCLDFLALSLGIAQGKVVAPALAIALHEVGDAIREQTARATEVRATDLLDAIGHFAWVQAEGATEPHQISSDRVPAGATVLVYPGEQIPVDGTVLQGEAIIDQQSLTGEAMPVVRREGEAVLASTLVRSGQLVLRAERVGRQTRAAASLELLQKAPVHDTRMANYAAKLADRLIWPSLLLATIVLVATRDPARAAAILTLDFVTGVRVSIPTAFLGALNHTTRHGILVRSGRTLEQLAEVDTVVFDKTGTLTEGAIAITSVAAIAGGLDADTILQLAAAAEQNLTHPVAAAIVNYARDRGLDLPARGEWSYEVGLGVRANIAGREVWVGSERFLHQASTRWGPSNEPLCCQVLEAPAGASAIYVACDGQFQGAIYYTDPLRPESAPLLERLQADYGIDIYLLTGDNPQRAAQVAGQLGIPAARVQAEAFPDEKARTVRELHRAGRTVAFVGDGLNDSVALAYADVSVSFARGAEIARETADVVLMNNSLLDLLEVIAIARQTRALIDQNIALVVVPNLAALGLATTVGLHPLAATAIHNGSAIAAGANSLRPLVAHQLAGERPA